MMGGSRVFDGNRAVRTRDLNVGGPRARGLYYVLAEYIPGAEQTYDESLWNRLADLGNFLGFVTCRRSGSLSQILHLFKVQ